MSELNKFTPGPWLVTGSMTMYVEARIPGGLIQEVAACGPTEADGGYGEQQSANALLISAAPDLLEALECALNALAHCKADAGYSSMQSRAASIADKAIKKARGQQ